ncbi:MAG TPA: glycosyltransferase, partial [Ignavibacteriaceae bacterium]
MEQVVLIGYFVSLSILFIFGLHGFVMMYYHRKYGHKIPVANKDFKDDVFVTIQLPLYNEMYVIERLIDSLCAIDYPKDKMEIQVLDDSTDETTSIVARAVEEKKKLGYDISHIRRGSREGFKAG